MKKSQVFSLISLIITLTGCQATTKSASVVQAAAITTTGGQNQQAGGQTSSPTPTGHYLYVANYNDVTITVFELNSDGSLSFVESQGIMTGATYLSLDTAGTTLYAGLAFSVGGSVQRIFQFSINASTGMLTLVNSNQSIFTAQAAGATFTTVSNFLTSGSTVYSIDGSGLIDQTTSGVLENTYQAASQPVTLLIK